ncbi:MAG TPA: hypothetical protein VMS38_04020 [Pseudorhodoferax sp.]|jgi:hypothetical protein|nr:hypothetical protein [Pseudorhodoferax sp.]
MALDPIVQLTRPAATRAVPRVPQERPQGDAGRTLRLLLAAGGAGEMLGRGENGQTYRLFPNGAQPGWREGQTLLVQVVRTGPPLEVRVLGTLTPEDAAAARSDTGADLPSLRPDQAAILRLAAAASDTMAQAAHWRQLSLTALRQASTVAPDHSALAPEVEAGAPDQAMLLRVLPWHGWPLTLWLEQRRWSGGTNRRARRRAGTRLCLALTLPALGRVALTLDVLDVQVGLTVTVASAAAVAPLRAEVGAIAARMARAGLRLMRCHVRHDPALVTPTVAAPSPTVGSHELPLALFRAGAEAMEALRRSVGAPAP